MNKEQAESELITPKLKQGEELIGFFQAIHKPSLWWFFIFVPIYIIGRRTYYVAVTVQGIHLYRLTLFGKLDTYNFFFWNEIEKLKLGRGFLTAPLKLKFSNGRKLKLSVQLIGTNKVAKLDEKTREFLFSKMS